MNGPIVKPWIDAIDAYVPGRAKADGAARVIKLSSNENPLGPSPKAIAAMAEIAGQAHRYPDGASYELREAIAAHHGLELERVVCGTGSDEILQLLAHVTPRTRIVYLANPNNPTGTVIGREAVARLHAGLRKDVLLVLDAAYAEYIDDPDYEDGIALARTAPNVITTRTFSKIYGLAAERVGWGYGPQPVIDAINKIRGPFNATSAGQAGALAALADQDWVKHCRDHNTRWRAWLADEVGKLGNAGLRAVPSAANFILVTFDDGGAVTAEAANKFLTAEGYLTRWLPKQGLGHGLRISIGTEEETRGVADALRRFVEQAA